MLLYEQNNAQPKTEQELIEKMSNAGIDFEPDTKVSYSNSNFALLTFILEKIYRKPYSELLEEKITIPLGLKNTYYGKKVNIKDNECNSYQYNFNGWEIESETDISLLLGAGGIVSTTIDLTLFSDALFNGKLITLNSLKQMQTLKDNMGIGLLPTTFHNKVSFGQSGRIDCFISFFSHSLADNISIAIITNGINHSFSDATSAILRAVFNMPFDIPEFNHELDENLDKYLGIYSSEQIPFKMSIIKNNGKLIGRLQAAGQGAFILEATGKDKFEHASAGIIVEFNPADKTMVFKQWEGVVNFVRED